MLADKEKRAKKRKSSQANYNITLEQPGPSHVDRHQIKFSSTSGEETDEEYTPVSDSNPKKPRPTEKAKNIMTSGLAAALDRTGVSDRNAVYILSEALADVGQNPSHFVLSRSSVGRKRTDYRLNAVQEIKEHFHPNEPLTVHWDGKLLEDLVGKKHVDRLPILVSGHGISKLLGVPKLVSGTGEVVATAVFNTIADWGISDQVSAMSFDTTASNTGHRAGACVLLEKKLGKSLLRLACRHHIMELVLGSAFEAAFGKSSSPNVILFKRFQQKWAFIDQSCYQPGPTDEHVKKHILPVLADILSFANAEFCVKHPRDDYRELLELTIIFVGESLPGGVVFKRPGAFHHARWMSKVLYCFKIWVFRDQFNLTKEEEIGIREIRLFSLLFV